MKLFHTSPTEIKQINTSGRFGEFLFFSAGVYVMTAIDAPVVYSLELDDADVIKADRLFWHEDASKLKGLVVELADRLSVEADDAEALIEESKSLYDMDLDLDADELADADWDIQHFTARAAKILGFRAVQVEDEQGAAWMVDMLGHESELEAV